MKRVIFLRHGKSDWDAGATDDHARPLNKRGRKAARAVGRFLTLAGQIPDRVVCSSAARTRETLDIASTAGEWSCDSECLDELYLCDPEAVLDVIRRQHASTGTLLVVGHEPTSSATVLRLSSVPGTSSGSTNIRFPTATMARVSLPIDCWQDASFQTGRLDWLVPPKLLTKGSFDFVE